MKINNRNIESSFNSTNNHNSNNNTNTTQQEHNTTRTQQEHHHSCDILYTNLRDNIILASRDKLSVMLNLSYNTVTYHWYDVNIIIISSSIIIPFLRSFNRIRNTKSGQWPSLGWVVILNLWLLHGEYVWVFSVAANLTWSMPYSRRTTVGISRTLWLPDETSRRSRCCGTNVVA